MARKKNKGGGGGALAIIIIIIMLAPIVIFLALLYYFGKTSEYFEKIKGTVSDFWLNNEEKERFKTLAEEYMEVEEKLEEVWKQVEENNIGINKDGTISRRSKLGKKLREITDKLEPIKYNLETELSKLMILPQKRWKEFNNSLRIYFALKKSLMTWFLSLIGTSVYYKILPWKLLYAYYKITPWCDSHLKNTEQSALFAMGLITLISFIFFLYRYWNIGEKYSPCPPEVDYVNFDEY